LFPGDQRTLFHGAFRRPRNARVRGRYP
jgi:hypothetical protein